MEYKLFAVRVFITDWERAIRFYTSWALLPDAGPSPVRFLELKELVSSWRGPGTLVLVTHALTVSPLTGFLPEQAETVVLQPTAGSPRGGNLVGRIAPPR